MMETKNTKKNQPKSAETLNADETSLRGRARGKGGRKNIPDETVARAVIEAGGKEGPAAKALGIAPRSLRDRIGSKAKNPSMRGLSKKARAEFRALLKRNVRELLEKRNERITIEMMHTKLGRELGFAPDVQKLELSGKVDGDLRLGVLDERAAAARLKALEEAK